MKRKLLILLAIFAIAIVMVLVALYVPNSLPVHSDFSAIYNTTLALVHRVPIYDLEQVEASLNLFASARGATQRATGRTLCELAADLKGKYASALMGAAASIVAQGRWNGAAVEPMLFPEKAEEFVQSRILVDLLRDTLAAVTDSDPASASMTAATQEAELLFDLSEALVDGERFNLPPHESRQFGVVHGSPATLGAQDEPLPMFQVARALARAARAGRALSRAHGSPAASSSRAAASATERPSARRRVGRAA